MYDGDCDNKIVCAFPVLCVCVHGRSVSDVCLHVSDLEKIFLFHTHCVGVRDCVCGGCRFLLFVSSFYLFSIDALAVCSMVWTWCSAYIFLSSFHPFSLVIPTRDTTLSLVATHCFLRRGLHFIKVTEVDTFPASVFAVPSTCKMALVSGQMVAP